MLLRLFIPLFLLPALFLFTGCKKEYIPEIKEGTNSFLVVSGFINTAENSVTKITLSRTVGLQDSVLFVPEEFADVTIESDGGNIYSLDYSGNGNYLSNMLNLDNGRRYRVNVETNDSKKYQSGFVAVKQTPAIDSIVWRQENKDVIIYANTHDPLNNTRYYWWDFEETWQYRTPNASIYGVNNGRIYVRPPEEQTQDCWTTGNSKGILIGTSSLLTDDVISMQPLLTIGNKDSKIYVRYSILVSQYGMTAEAYDYWKKIKNNSQQLGTLFDEQPSQLRGNMYSVSDPGEPVIGFIGAAKQQQQRVFIQHDQLADWGFDPFTGYICAPLIVAQNPDPYEYNYDVPGYVPWYFVTGGLYLITRECVDCTLRGGTNQRPSFW